MPSLPPTQFDKMKFLSRVGVRQSTFAGWMGAQGKKGHLLRDTFKYKSLFLGDDK